MLRIEFVIDNDSQRFEKTLQNTVTRIEREGCDIKTVQFAQVADPLHNTKILYSALITYTTRI